MAIIITREGKNAQKVEKTSFQDEANLQKYIYENPESVPLYEIDEDIKLLILAREFPVEGRYIDALGVDKKGEIYIIETKLYKNPDKRTVIAQVLEYGAAMSFSLKNFSDFVQIVESKRARDYQFGLNRRLMEAFQLDEESTTLVLENVARNLNNGKFRFVVLMDTIDPRLKELILFINKNSRFDIYGVELEYYKHAGYEIVIPKLHGAEVKKDMDAGSSSISSRRKWDERTFFEAVESKLPKVDVSAIRNLYALAKKTADKITWGTGSVNGSFNPIYYGICPRSLFSVYTDGTLFINHHWMDDTPEMTRAKEKLLGKILELLQLPSGTTISSIDFSQWKGIYSEFFELVIELQNGQLE